MLASAEPYVPKPPPSPKTRPKKAQALAQLLAIQKRLFEATQDPETTGPSLAQIARAWSELEERKRVLRMKPAPKPIDVSADQKPKRSRAREGAKPFTEG